MIDILNTKINSPFRKTLGKAELYTSSAHTIYGSRVVANGICQTNGDIQVKATSKNYVKYPYIDTTKTENGVTFTDNGDGSITINGTAEGAPAYFTFCETYIPRTICTMSVLPSGTMNSDGKSGFRCKFYKGSTNTNNVTLYSNWQTSARAGYDFDTLADYDRVVVEVYVGIGSTVDNVTIYPQIECGNVATPFTVYTEDFAGEEIEVQSKNLFDYSVKYNVKAYDIANATLIEELDNGVIVQGNASTAVGGSYSNGWYRAGNRAFTRDGTGVHLKAGEKVTVSAEYTVLEAAENRGETVGILMYGTNSHTTNRNPQIPEPNVKTRISNTFTVKGDGYYYPVFSLNSCKVKIENIQIELGDTATNYAPYVAPSTVALDENGATTLKPVACSNSIFSKREDMSIEATYFTNATIGAYRATDALKEITIERVGESSKFFGFGVGQKLNLKLINADKPTTSDYFRIYFGDEVYNYDTNFPFFYVTESHRDEKSGELSITAYDLLKKFEEHKVSELALSSSYTIREFAAACGNLFALNLSIRNLSGGNFDLAYENGANFEGTETIREALNAVAEATQTIYYIDGSYLVFKRLGSAAADLQITKEDYIELKSGENRRLQAICSTNELGDSVTASIAAIGTTQYIRNNPFFELREDIGTILDNSIAALGGFAINQFECSWRGNYALEIGDQIELTTKENDSVTSFILDDTIKYNGALSQNSRWAYEDNEAETADNPTSLGEALKQTFARVDKANKEITLLASETEANSEAVSELKVNTNSISASVFNLETNINNSLTNTNEEIITLKQQVETRTTAEEVNIQIKSELENGVTKVATNTGFTFDDEGLTVEKDGSEMKTQITEDGMTVYKQDEAMLTADNTGVKAVNLRASTYLIIGKNSRFQDYKENRTACFWIGG